MKILVFADTHRSFDKLYNIVLKHNDIGTIIHAGDCAGEVDDLCAVMPNKIIFNVSGNCDCYGAAKSKIITKIENKVFFITHGHNENVKNSLNVITGLAASANADIVIYGHTHMPHVSKQGRLHIFNPGSITQPRGGYKPTYGIIDITDGEINCNIIEVS